jgi:hypothetical protein
LSLDLVARDPATLRSSRLPLATGWDEDTDPELLAAYLTNLATQTARNWAQRYSVPAPMRRLQWSIEAGNG